MPAAQQTQQPKRIIEHIAEIDRLCSEIQFSKAEIKGFEHEAVIQTVQDLQARIESDLKKIDEISKNIVKFEEMMDQKLNIVMDYLDLIRQLALEIPEKKLESLDEAKEVCTEMKKAIALMNKKCPDVLENLWMNI